MSKEINIKLFSILNKPETEDVEIRGDDINYVSYRISNKCYGGIQVNNKKSEKKALKLCRKIEDLVYKLRGVLDE
jgi:hypothetical protein